MTLAFPNSSRSFDAARNAIHFIGYDGMLQVRFFVEARALTAPGRSPLTEAESLTAFDAARGSIHDVARKAYSRSRRDTYTLTTTDCQ